ncbi:MAG: hypothetical protein K0R61_3908 [Microvirga sp.]|nr:hypothetical protein [Microvirga sp.]
MGTVPPLASLIIMRTVAEYRIRPARPALCTASVTSNHCLDVGGAQVELFGAETRWLSSVIRAM